MRYSKLFGKTRHNPPCDADSINAKLLTQAGYIEKLSSGIYHLLPLGHRVFTKICNIIREEMNSVEGQEILMPALHPIEIWKTTGRDLTMDDILYRSKASGNKDFVFGPSHEETVTPLAQQYINSYKDLPLSLYQVQTKFRDEPRAKSGLLRGREFGMKDMYSFHVSEDDLDQYYEKVKEAYFRVYRRCGLNAYIVEASGGAFSDKISHEFSLPTEAGEDTILISPSSEVAQNLEIAVGNLPETYIEEKELPLQKVEIERGMSVLDNAKAHGVPEYKILKSVIYEIEGGGLLGVVIRGDLSVSDHKLENYLKKQLRPASPEKLKEAGLVQGYISPVNNPVDLPFIADKSVLSANNYVTGANVLGVDYINVNQGRDFVVKDTVDLVEVRAGFLDKNSGEPLKEIKAIEVGNIFKLGTKYSEAFGLNFTDSDGKQKPVIMGCYGIGTTRMIGSIVEASNDENGIIWPKSVAPFHVFLARLGNDDAVNIEADKIYEELTNAGIEVLYDDRDLNPGVKFKDADLIGLPVRIVVSKRTLEQESVEWKLRTEGEARILKIKDLKDELISFLND